MEQQEAADLALHRTISLREESSTGTVLSTNSVEIWQSGKLHSTSRRLYDPQHRVVAAEWSNPDGSVTVVGRRSLNWRSDHSPSAQPNCENAWRFDPSAEQLVRLAAATFVKLKVEPNDFLFSSARSESPSSTDGLVTANLRIGWSRLHASAAVLAIRQGGSIRTFYYDELNGQMFIATGRFRREHETMTHKPRKSKTWLLKG
jgi:hypothetical protein